MINSMLPLHSLSPVSGKSVVATFDGGLLSSDGGVLMLREVEQRLRIADRFAGCIEDPRAPDQITHALADIIRFRLLMIAAGYEDGNDANGLRVDPIFKMAHDLTPSDHELCSQSTISRLENLPDVRALLRMGRAMVDLYCESFRQVPKRIVLDIDDTFDAVHGGQQLRLFNAHYDEYGFQPIVVFDGEGRFVTAVLRPAKRPGGKEIRAFLRRLLRAIRTNWPNTQILLRADSHYCCPEVIDWCRANGLDYILGVAPTTTLRRHIEGLEASTKARFEAAPKEGKARRFKEFFDGAASWSRVERIVARVEAGAEGPDTRFIVTNLKVRNVIRKWGATDAAVHDSQKLDDVLDLSNTGKEVWADSAYRSVQIEAGLEEKGLQSRIHRRAARNRPLTERQKSANTTRSKVRARVEHVFGHQQSAMGGKIVRTIGIVRARFKIGMMNLGYNIRRLVQLERMAAAPV